MAQFRLNVANPVPRRFRGFRPRVLFVMALFTLAAAVLVWRAFDLQVLQHDRLLSLRERQSQRMLRINGKRGPIYDRTGRRMAVSLEAESVYAHPAQIPNPALAAFRLSRALDLPREDLETDLSSDRPFVWIKRQLLPAEADQVRALDLKGLGFTKEFRRVYPGRFRGAALVGFTGVDLQGLEGLEYAYDSYLRGADGLRIFETDALGRIVLRSYTGEPAAGGSLTLTIDPVLQYLAERELAAGVERSQAKRGVAIVLDTRTGQILAMAHAPAFNPNTFSAYDKDTYFNRAVTSGYEPGSTFKILTLATALEEGVIRPDSLFFCENGEMAYYDGVIHDTHPHGWLDPAGVIRVSSNICAAKIGTLIPPTVFHAYLQRFGFGSRLGLFTGPDGQRLAGEAEGLLHAPEDWTPVDHAAIAFGHGILVSPLQMITAINAIANGGELLMPILVREVRGPDGQVVQRQERRVLRRIVSRATADQLVEYMEAVPREGGTGTAAALANYTVAGKTGTTEKYDLQARGYSKTRLIASFVGFVPSRDPALTILVLVEEPQRGQSGGTVAAPIFRDIAARALPLLGVWPPEQVRHLSLDAARNAARAAGTSGGSAASP